MDIYYIRASYQFSKKPRKTKRNLKHQDDFIIPASSTEDATAKVKRHLASRCWGRKRLTVRVDEAFPLV